MISAVTGIEYASVSLTDSYAMWISVVILAVLFQMQRFGTGKLGNIFAPILLAWFFSIASIGVFNLVKYDPGVLQAFNPRCIWVYLSKNPKNAWKSLAGIVLCLTGIYAFSILM